MSKSVYINNRKLYYFIRGDCSIYVVFIVCSLCTKEESGRRGCSDGEMKNGRERREKIFF